MADRETATGVLGLVQAYVNTVDLQDGPEELSSTAALETWLVSRGLMEAGKAATEADLRHAKAVREAIRGLVGAHSGSPVYPLDVATLNEATVVSRLRARFSADGKARMEPEAGGVAGAMGRIVAAVYAAMAEEEWPRLKLCGLQTCRWAFYDHSRNHSSRWCDMAECGNRQKARRFRQRAKAGA